MSTLTAERPASRQRAAASHDAQRSERPRRARAETVMNIRLTSEMRDIIDSAAQATGKTRSEFVLDIVRKCAIDVLLDQRLFSLDPKNFDAFLATLDAPPPDNAALKAAFNRKAPWEE